MATAITYKHIKKFSSTTVSGTYLDTTLNEVINDKQGNVIAIVPVTGEHETYRVVYFTVDKVPVEVDIPDELAAEVAIDNQADGVKVE